jgi:hypothetical protein
MFLYAAVSLLNHFFCDRAIIDKTVFYEITCPKNKYNEVMANYLK